MEEMSEFSSIISNAKEELTRKETEQEIESIQHALEDMNR
jgi:hypothetical protein